VIFVPFVVRIFSESGYRQESKLRSEG